jgi:HEPN domain-containing protein
MDSNNINPERLISFWVAASDDDYETMIAMYDTKRYSWALFLGHLMIEKLLKAYHIKVNGTQPPYIHNLLRLAQGCKISMNDEQEFFFANVTSFNINTRYDDYKMTFQKKCTKEYTDEWIQKININRQWIKELIQQ